MDTLLFIIATINLLLVIGLAWVCVPLAANCVASLLLAVLWVELTNTTGSKWLDSVLMEPQTPVPFCTARPCEPAKPLATTVFRPTF